MYLKMQLPTQLATAARVRQPVQLGVVLAPMDNQAGEQINGNVCRIVRALGSGQKGQEVEAQIAQLNNLLAGRR